jgi:hypothetical protein
LIAEWKAELRPVGRECQKRFFADHLGLVVRGGVLETAEAQLLRNKKHSLSHLCCFKLASTQLWPGICYALNLVLNTAGAADGSARKS